MARDLQNLARVRIEYAPHLLDAVVRRHVDLNTADIAATYRRLYDELAEIGLHRDPDRLASLNYYAFQRLGLNRPVETAAAEFPATPRHVRVGTADRVEGCFLPVARDAVLVRLQPERFEDPAGLTRYLVHEWRHVADMVAPEFGYPVEDPPELSPPAQERYALLWGAHCDARIERSGREPLRPAAAWQAGFDRSWGHVEAEVRRQGFERFRTEDLIPHPRLLSMATEPAEWVRIYCRSGKPAGAPGSPCPLCGFPTFNWIFPNGRLDVRIARAIQEDFPGWRRAQGACERCVELYELRAGASTNARR